MNLSQGTIYTACLAQLGITVLVLLYFPAVYVQCFSCHPLVVNGSADLSAPAPVRGGTLSVALPVLTASVMTALFTMNTLHIGKQAQGLEMDYGKDAIDSAGLWDAIFWAYCTLSHGIVVAMVASPGDVFAVGLAAALLAYFLNRACYPKATQIQLTQENLNLLGYCVGILVTFYAAQPGSTRMSAIFFMVLVDYFLGIGHTWDQPPSMHTVCNCRVFYVCSCSLCVAGLYGAWHDPALGQG